MLAGTELLAALPVAVYMTDAEGRLTFYNDAAAEFWGHRPELGADRWCGSWRLYWPDGRPLPHAECPMAQALKEGRPIRGVEAVAERPDGTRVPFMPYPTPLKDASGQVIGAINLLVDIAARKHADIETARLAAIVSSSDDAIISKTLRGDVTTWNAGATRIFGYEAEEMIGQSIRRIIPPELQQEEEEILAKLKRGERIDHYDTVRVTKDGRRVHISLTVSPLRDSAGHLVGASKVARDVTERKRSEELQRLLLDELNHRVKNTLATVQAIANQSLRRAASPADFVASFTGRIQALSRAHDLLVQRKMQGAEIMDIVREQVVLGGADRGRVACSGPLLMLATRAAVQLALVLHELATNARKYGALSVPTGRLAINWTVRMEGERQLLLTWQESGVGPVTAPASQGFGTTLIERTIQANGGAAAIHYGADGIAWEIRLPLRDEVQHIWEKEAARSEHKPRALSESRSADLQGRRILLIEDEPLVAMEIESQLASHGCDVVGPIGTVARAMRAVADDVFDAVVLDANLGGQPVDEVAAALTHKGVPFAFATGYGREALPPAFREAPVLTKPFSPEQLILTIKALLGDKDRPPGVVPFRPHRM